MFLLLVGENVSVNLDPATIAFSLLDLAASLPNVAHFFVGEILPRGDFSRSPGLTPESFERQRGRDNRILRSSLGRRLVPFHIQLKIPTVVSRDYCRDRVHLSAFGFVPNGPFQVHSKIEDDPFIPWGFHLVLLVGWLVVLGLTAL